MGRLEGRVAVVTGGSRGIGEAIALAFAQEGARVAVVSRKAENVAAAAARINAVVPGSAVAVPCHVGDPAAIEAMFRTVVEQLGTPAVLVNNAGTNPHFGPLLDVEMGAWRKTFEVNLEGPFLCTRAFCNLQFALPKPSGSVIFTSSILGLRGARFQGVYGMTKASLISMVQTLAQELGTSGIRVNAIAPGFVDTRLAETLTSSPQIREMLMARTPLGRIAEPREIAGAAVYLASDESSYTTGTTIVVDGGAITH